MDDAAFRRRIEDITSRYRVSDAVRRRTKLRRSGAEWTGLCPFHIEKTGSFTVNDAKGFAHCFGCSWHGDVIDFIRATERVTFLEALAMLDGGALPEVDPAEMARAKAEDEALDLEKVAAAQSFWDEAGPVVGTPADLYLCWRQIFVRPPELRFGMVPSWRSEDGRWGPRRPALLILAQSLAGEFLGIQRIFLTADGGKAPMRKPKLSLGAIHGASIRFGRPRDEVIVTGGPEDGLTLFQRYAEQATVYVSCGEAMLPFLRLPRSTRRVTIARQNDAPGIEAARKAAIAFREQGREVLMIAPKPAFKDWNDELRGIRRHG